MTRSAWMVLCCGVAMALGCQGEGPPVGDGARTRADGTRNVREMIGGAEIDAWTSAREGYGAVVGPSRAARQAGDIIPSSRPLRVTLPRRADQPWQLQGVDGWEVAVRRRGAEASPCGERRGVIHCSSVRPGMDALVFVDGARLEELLVLAEPAAGLGYDLTLPAGWRLSAVPRDPQTVEARDGSGAAQLRIAAPAAWDADGEPVAVWLQVDPRGIALHVGEAEAWPVVVDPAFTDASVPLRLRIAHTATLLLDGRVLIAGGLTDDLVDDTVEIYDPASGVSTAVDPLDEPRTSHTATLLRDGRVLVAGGTGTSGPLATTEIFDPATETFSSGPALSQSRTGHTATRLPSGQVLLAAGGNGTAELFDPATDTTVATGSSSEPFVSGHAAALLPDGRVLLVGRAQGSGLPHAEVFDPTANGGVGGFTVTGTPVELDPVGHTLTALRDGQVLLLGGCPCSVLPGPAQTSRVAELWDPTAAGGVGAFTKTGDAVRHRTQHSATLLPSGEVLVAGSFDEAPSPEQSTAEIFDPVSGSFSELADPLPAPHFWHTATLLPTGDVLLFGGDQASAALFVGSGSTGPGSFAATAGAMAAGRYQHTATTLKDGRVLVAGGGSGIALPPQRQTAELFDPAVRTFAGTGSMSTARQQHTATLLADGEVLVAGGLSGLLPTASAELFDPAADGGAGAFSSAGTLLEARHSHTATPLPDGRILLAGGEGTLGPLATAELYDPAAGTFTASSGPMTAARVGHGAALLQTGKVLIVGALSAELYDPLTDTFTPTASPGTAYAEASVVVLASGKALVTGSSTLAAELFDPVTETFSFAGADSVPRGGHQAVALLTGGALVAGGQDWGAEPNVHADARLFDPLSEAFVAVPALGTARTLAASALLPTGEVLVAGGLDDIFFPQPPPVASAEIWSPNEADPAWRPTIVAAPESATPGELVVIQATGLEGPEASSGRSNASATNHPVVLWRPVDGGPPLARRATAWTADTVTWQAPPTAAHGPGWVTIAVNGIASEARLLTIDAAPAGGACGYDAQCASEHCADGVCCDVACDGLCEACTAELKGDGEDGTCGPVPPERYPDDDCVLPRGTPCTADAQCITAHCADGVCCETECTAQCEACDVADSVGLCVPVLGAPHGDRPACDAVPPADLCDGRLCDGAVRDSCAATAGPCTPYACTATGCLDRCDEDGECAVGHHCEGEECQGGQCDGAMATTPEGEQLDCSPYLCQADGTCRQSCADVGDCVEPYACNFEGRCVARPPNDDFSAGCGCRLTAPRRRGAGSLWLLLGAFGLVAARRRGRGGRPRWLVPFGLVGSVVLASSGLMAQPTDPVAPEPPPDAAEEGERAEPEAASPTPGDEQPGATEPPAEAPAAEPAPPAPKPSPPAPNAEDLEAKRAALERFQRGLALGKEGAWSAALAEFRASRDLYPTRVALKNVALCYRKLARFDESLDAYEALLREYPDVKRSEQTLVAGQVTELRQRVGSIEIDAAEPGASILIDGRPRGTYPTAGPLRVSAGAHVVRVHHDGFEPFEKRLEVAGRRTVRVVARLEPLVESGTLAITELAGKRLEVLVDNVAVGKTPWEGRLSIGQHAVRLQGPNQLGTAPVPAPIRTNQTTALQLEAVKLDSELRVAPMPGSAQIAIDSVVVGRGVWDGRLPSGTHRLEIAEEGFFPVRKTLELASGARQDLRFDLQRDEDAEIWQLPSKFTFDLTGALALAPSFGGEVTGGCAEGCSQSPGLGLLAFLHVGYEFGSGFGFGLAGGYLEAHQDVEGRVTTVHPVGLESRTGTSSDSLRLRGFALGATASYVLGEEYPVLLRLGAGPLFGTLRDRRVGTFPSDGMTYQAGPIEQEPSATYFYVDPEVRVSVPIGDYVEVGASLQVMVLIALAEPTWDAAREIDAAVDGIGVTGGETLTGGALVFFAPGIGAQAKF